MMELDILMVIAEVAVAISGFSAVVANFSKHWSSKQSRQLKNLLFHSGIALFASLVPLVVSQRMDDSGLTTLWLISSGLYILFASISIALELKQRGPKQPLRARALYVGPFIVAMAALGFNIAQGAEAWLYLLALLLNLAYAFFAFLSLLSHLTDIDATKAEEAR